MSVSAGKYRLAITTVTSAMQVTGKIIALGFLASPLSTFGLVMGWLLSGGVWMDNGVWDDAAEWKDEP
jgi:hypothetical protein